MNLVVGISLQKASNLRLREMLSLSNGLRAVLSLHCRQTETLYFGVITMQPEHVVPKGKTVIILCTRKLNNAIKVENALPGWWQGLLGKCNIFN